ncbi:MAG: thioredoxin-dependent thiol peroxidase [Bacteroidota bacterium]
MTTLKEGMPAPAFQGVDQNGETVSLAKLQGKKVVLYFYPKDNTPGCTAEACNLRDNFDHFRKQGFEIIGISPDSETSHKKFSAKNELPFPLLSDPDKEILKAYGAWGEKKMYGKTYEGVLRSTFIIDENGTIEKIFKKVKTKDHSNQIFSELNINQE